MKTKIITRRDFLKSTTTAAAAGTLYFNQPGKIFSATEKKSKVILIRNKDLLDKANKPKAEVVKQMLDKAVQTLLEEKDADQAWKKLIKPDDVVGIKSNIWSYLPTTIQVEETIKERVMNAGVPAKNISIRDRGLLSDPIFKKATALINARPMRTHHWSGVGSLLKNYIMFTKKPYTYHPDSCADLAAIWKLPLVAGKTRLNILIMFTPLFHGVGPHHFNAEYIWPYKGMLVGLDPVALDATGVRILQAKRKAFFNEERPLNPPPKHILLADTRHNLGNADPGKIELIKLGWDEDILI
jgi:hypothetical protein